MYLNCSDIKQGTTFCDILVNKGFSRNRAAEKLLRRSAKGRVVWSLQKQISSAMSRILSHTRRRYRIALSGTTPAGTGRSVCRHATLQPQTPLLASAP